MRFQKAAVLAAAAILTVGVLPAAAQDAQPITPEEAALRAQMLQIPGVGKGSPTDADWQKIGELAMGPTKETIAPGECRALTGDDALGFMGLINQNLHNFLYRGFLKPWEEYTGAQIAWIDLSQRDYNGFLQLAIASDQVNWDIMEMGAPFEGDMAGRGLLDPMPDWVPAQIDMADYVSYLKAPIGTWDDVTYRISVDGDTHSYAYRKDYYESKELAAAWATEGDGSEWAPPTTWEQLNAHSKFLAGKTDPTFGGPAYGVLDPLNYIWGGFGFYFLEDRAVAYSKYPGEPAWLFDPDTMEPLVNNPGWVQAIQDVIDLKDTPGAYPPDQINQDPNLAFSQFLPGTGSSILWWGDVGSQARTTDTSVVGDYLGFDINPGATRVYNWRTKAWEDTPNRAPNNAYIGWGVYVVDREARVPTKTITEKDGTKTVIDDMNALRRKCAWSAAALLGGKDLSLWTAAYPSGFQPYRNSHFNIDEWVAAGYDRAFIEDYLSSNADSYNHPNGANEPRIPGIFQYYSRGEDELVKGLGTGASAQEIADNIYAAWEELTNSIGREQQLNLYRASLGLPPKGS